jgi:phage I-like protein
MTVRTAEWIVALSSDQIAASNEQWVHLLPLGAIKGRDGRRWSLSDPATVIAASQEYAGPTLMPVDYDHQVDNTARNGQPAPAAGWIKELQARPNGIWGLVEWTERAAAHLHAKEYRYLSPTFHHSKDGVVLKILRAALTNNPALELTALASSEDSMIDLNELRQILDLQEDADESTIMAAIRDLVTARQSAQPDPSQFVPIQEFERVTARMNELNQGVSRQSAEIAVAREIESGRLAPMLREWGVALCTSNKPAFDSFVGKTSTGLQNLFTATLSVSPNGKTPAGRTAVSDEQLAVCNALGHKPEELVVTERSK